MSFVRRLPLRQRFLLLLLPLFLGPPLALGWLGQHTLRKTFERETQTHLSAQLLSRILPLSVRLQSIQESLEAFVHHGDDHPLPATVPSDPGAQQGWVHEARHLLEQWSEVEEVFLTLPAGSGRLISRVGSQLQDQHRVEPGGGPAWAWPPSSTSVLGDRMLQVSSRFDDAPLGVDPRDTGPELWLASSPPGHPEIGFGVVLSRDCVDSYFDELGALPGARGLLLHVDGTVLYPQLSTSDSTRGAAGSGRELLHATVLRADQPLVLQQFGAQPSLLAIHRDLSLGLAAGYLVPRSALAQDLERMRQTMWWTIALGCLLALALISTLSAWVTGPLRRLSATMEQVKSGNLRQRLPVEGDDEVAQLFRSFNTMILDLDASQRALRSQKQQLSRALAEVESVERMKDSFLALVSHEVRTPLTSIMGGVEFLRDEFETPEPDRGTAKEFLGIVYDSSRRLAGFMNDAILMAQLQASRSRECFEEFSLSALIQTKLDEIVDRFADREVRLELRLRERGELFVDGDWTLLQVAIEKVLHNAFQHNEAGGRVSVDLVEKIMEEPAVELRTLMRQRGIQMDRPQSRWFALRVFNTGPIIPTDRMCSLFQRFELIHDIEHHQRGSGLSLPIVGYVMEFHHGAVEARAAAGEGMAFYLVLPGRLLERDSLPEQDIRGDVDGTVTVARIVGHSRDFARDATVPGLPASEVHSMHDESQGDLDPTIPAEVAPIAADSQIKTPVSSP